MGKARGVLARTILALALAAPAACGGPSAPSGPVEKLTIAYPSVYVGSALLAVASEAGFFRDAGLAVTLQPHTLGKAAFEAMLAGEADIGVCAETPIVFAALRGEPFAIVATVARSVGDYGIVIRTGPGIASPADLKGRRVGVTAGSTGHYVLASLLASSGTPESEVVLVDLKPEALAPAFAKGRVDAVATWEPYLSIAREGVEGAITFPSDPLFRATLDLTSRRELVNERPESLRRLMRALVAAERFSAERPAEARAMFARVGGQSPETVARGWPSFSLRVSLDQSLLDLVDSEARWARFAGLAPAGASFNALDLLAPEALESVRPDAVAIYGRKRP